jgi:putative copper resistance protein D
VIDPLILVRSVHIAATMLAAGTIWFMVLVAEPAARAINAAMVVDLSTLRRRLTLMIWSALGVAILSGAGWLVLLAADIYGAPILEVCLHGGAWQVATDTRFGQVASARLALALLLGLLMLWPAARWLALVAAIGLLALIALIGHAGAAPSLAGRLHLASDMVHLLGAGAWLGALPALAMLLGQARRGSEPAWGAVATAAASRFSLLGIVCVAVLLVGGLINSWNLLAGPRDLVATDYGRLLLLKIGLFVAMVIIAAVNKYYLIPRLPAPAALRGLQRNSLAETALGIGVLLFVGALGTMEPAAHVHTSSSEIPPDAAFVHIHSSEAMADVTINPGRAGPAKVTIRVFRDDSSDFVAKDVRLALDPPAAGLKSVERATIRMPDGSWQADDIDIPQAGIWTVRVTIAPETGQLVVLDAPIVIER